MRRQDEDFALWVVKIEVLHVSGMVLGICATVEVKLLPVHHLRGVRHDVHDLRHKDEDTNLNAEIRIR
jgi:hypothetical protein